MLTVTRRPVEIILGGCRPNQNKKNKKLNRILLMDQNYTH